MGDNMELWNFRTKARDVYLDVMILKNIVEDQF